MLDLSISQSTENNKAVFNTVFKDFLANPIWVAVNVSKEKPVHINTKDGSYAKVNDLTTLTTYLDVSLFIKQQSQGRWFPGITLSKNLGISIIDLDDVIDPISGKIISKEAQEIVNSLDSYTEISKSGTGLHIVCRANLPGSGLKKGNVEIYDDKKFITLTSNCYGECRDINEAQDAVSSLYSRYKPKLKETSSELTQLSPVLTDDEIIEMCRNDALYRDKFIKLFDNGDKSDFKDSSDDGIDESEADFQLCRCIAFYTQDKEQLNTLFLESKLYKNKDLKHKKKWEEREDYKQKTIQKAIAGCNKVYTGNKQASEKEVDWDNPATIDDGEDLEISFPLDSLPQVLKDAVTEISENYKVDPALAVLPGIGIAALQIGKKATVKEKDGLYHHPSLFLCGVAETGERKSSCYNAMLDGIKDAIELETEEHNLLKADVRAYNELIEEQAQEIKKGIKNGSSSLETARDTLKKLYASKKEMPPEPYNFGDDLTPERLFQKLSEHKGAYGVFSSDARGIFTKILGKGNKDGNTGEVIYLGGMWGDDISRSRVSNNKGALGGEDLLLRKPALTTVGFVQPDRFAELVRDKTMRHSGLIARIGLVIATSQMGTRLESVDDKPLNQEKIKPFTKAVLNIRRWAPEKTVVVSLSPEAAKRRIEFYNSIELELGIGGRFEDVKDIATKATSLAARLALIFSVVDHMSSASPASTIPDISEEQWLRAQSLQEYFLAQSIDCVRSHSPSGSVHTIQKVAKWIKKKIKDSTEPVFVLVSSICKGVRGSDKKEIETKIIPELLKQGWLRYAGIVRGGAIRYEVNRKVK